MFTAPRTELIDRIYVHTNEGGEGDRSAWGLKGYLNTITAGYHVIVDNQDTVRCAADEDVVAACGGDNQRTLSVCIIGRAGQTAVEWADAYSRSAIERAAQQVAEWCIAYDIPVERILPGAPPTDRGIGGHVDNRHPNSGGHTDPGVWFPWTIFLGRVRVLAEPPIDWVALKALADWQVRVSKFPLRYKERSPDVSILKQLLKLRGYTPLFTGTLFGWWLRRHVHQFKLDEHLANTDGEVFGADAARAILS